MFTLQRTFGILAGLFVLAVHLAAQDPVVRAPEILTPEQSFEKRLAGHRYFKKVELNRVDAYAPFVCWVQRVAHEVPTYRTNVAREYGPWLLELKRLLERDVLGPDPKAAVGDLFPVIVLASSGDYSNYLQVGGSRGLYGFMANHDEHLNAVVAFQDAFGGRVPAFRKRLPVLRKGVHILLTSRSPLARPAAEVWLTEGLAGYLSFHLGAKPSDLEKRPIDRKSLEVLFSVRRSPERTQAYWMSLAELADVRGDAALRALAKARLGDRATSSGASTLYETFDALTQLWVRFLLESNQGRYRAAFAKYVGLALADEGGPEILARTLNVASLADLELEFRAWVDDVFRDTLGARIEPAVADVDASPDPAVREELPAFDPSDLEVELDEIARALGYGLWLARTGDLTHAAAALDAAVELGEEDGEPRARAERARGRVELLRAARDAFLADLAASKGELRVTIDGRKIRVTADRIEGGVLHFAATRDGVERVPLDRISAEDVALALGKRVARYGPEWLRGWGLALGGDNKWKRYARAGEGADAVVRDVQADLPQLLRTGEAVARLNDLAARGLPGSEADARRIVDSIVALNADMGDVGVVLAYQGELAQFAATALGVHFDRMGAEGALEGTFERLDDGRVRITYDFEDLAELQDFVLDPEFLVARRGVVKFVKYADQPRIELGGGRLEIAGALALVHRLQFAAPSSIRVDLSYGWPPAGVDPTVLVMFGLAYSGERSYVSDIAFEKMEVWSGSVEVSGSIEGHDMDPEKVYSGELHLEGADDVSLWLGGKRLHGRKARGNEVGQTFFWFEADFPCWLDKIVVEGVPTATSVAEVRAAWVRAKVVELGLDD